MIKKCENCGKDYKAAHPNIQKFCSRECYYNNQRKNKVSKVRYIDLKPGLEDEDTDKIFDALIKYQEATHKLSSRQDEVTIKINTEEPIYIAFLADIHIGAVGTNYKEFKDTIDVISKMPNMYLVSVGDTIDNFLPGWHSEGQFEAICPPEIQKRLLEYMYSKLKGRIIALVQGDHDESSHFVDDFDWTKYLCEKFKCADLGFGGFIHLTVGKQKYTILARHKYRFSSQFNLTHCVKRMREQIGDFDIGVVAHNHQASIEFVDMVDKTRVFVRPGSFKGADRYARKVGFVSAKSGKAMMPIVKLYPKERTMIVYPDVSYLLKEKSK